MRIAKNLRVDQETITRFLAVLGGASVVLGASKYARPGLFIHANEFIQEYIQAGFFRKEEVLIKVLEDGGFSPDDGPIRAMRDDQKKCHEAAEILISAANRWQDGDDSARPEVGWATSVFTTAIRQHMDRLKNHIFPLLEQTIPMDEEHKVSEEVNALVFEGDLKDGPAKYIKLLEKMEDELSDWK